MTKKQEEAVKKIKWRLGDLPTIGDLRDLVKDEILTKDEAREILLSFETQESTDKKGLEKELEYLRRLVEKLSERDPVVVYKYFATHAPNWYYHNYEPVWYKTTMSTLNTNPAVVNYVNSGGDSMRLTSGSIVGKSSGVHNVSL